MLDTLILILQVWAIGGMVCVLLLLVTEGGWKDLVKRMGEDNPAEGLLSNEQAAGACIIICFIVWPYVLIESLLTKGEDDV